MLLLDTIVNSVGKVLMLVNYVFGSNVHDVKWQKGCPHGLAMGHVCF